VPVLLLGPRSVFQPSGCPGWRRSQLRSALRTLRRGRRPRGPGARNQGGRRAVDGWLRIRPCRSSLDRNPRPSSLKPRAGTSSALGTYFKEHLHPVRPGSRPQDIARVKRRFSTAPLIYASAAALPGAALRGHVSAPPSRPANHSSRFSSGTGGSSTCEWGRIEPSSLTHASTPPLPMIQPRHPTASGLE
jgi:hypothetical protein